MLIPDFPADKVSIHFVTSVIIHRHEVLNH